MTDRLFHLTPPVQKAIAELAYAYRDYHLVVRLHASQTQRNLMESVAERLINAQNEIGVELVKNELLQSYFKAEAA